jgi:hypothetical protein
MIPDFFTRYCSALSIVELKRYDARPGPQARAMFAGWGGTPACVPSDVL